MSGYTQQSEARKRSQKKIREDEFEEVSLQMINNCTTYSKKVEQEGSYNSEETSENELEIVNQDIEYIQCDSNIRLLRPVGLLTEQQSKLAPGPSSKKHVEFSEDILCCDINDSDSQICKKSKQHRQWIAAIIATHTLFMMGMCLGWSSPVIKKLQEPDSDIQLSDEEISWMVSLLYIGSMASPIPTGLIMDRFGRKAGLYLTALEGLLSWIILLITTSTWGIYLARFLGGMVGGSGYTVAPIYLSEIAEPEVRGALNSIFTLLAYIGIMFEYSIGPNVPYTVLNLLSLLIPLIIMVLLYFIPESPYFYMMKENRESAMKSLAWLRCEESKNVEDELNVIEKAVSEDMKNKKNIFDLVKSKGNRKALFMTESLAILQRMSGISVIMAYAASAAPSSWVLNNDQCAMLICLTWIIFGFWSTVLVDRLGRKPLTVISCAGCGIAMGLYGAWNYLGVKTAFDSSPYDWFPFATLVMYSAFFPIGLGCVPNMIQGEVFPANIKGIASGITSVVIALTSFITNKIYQPIGSAYGIYVNYFTYAVFSMYGIYFGLFLLIETKGKTLQEIQTELTQSKKIKNQNNEVKL